MVSIVSGAPSIITGRRRPKRERTLSDHDPDQRVGGGVQAHADRQATPTRLPDMPRTAV